MSGLLDEPLKVLNIGIEEFFSTLRDQDVEAVHLVWRPPGTDPTGAGAAPVGEIAELLRKLL